MGASISDKAGPPTALVVVVTLATGALIANIYYAQPLIASIASSIGVSPALAGTVVGVTQISYGLGLFLLVSLADLAENRVLVLSMIGVTAIGLLAAATAGSAVAFFTAALLIGLGSTSAQILLPFLAQMVPVDQRGRVLGNVMAGVLTGVMLARPVALFIAQPFGWRAVFWFSLGLMVLIGVGLWRLLPRYRPAANLNYGQILGSMAGLLGSSPALRHRAAYQALMFAGFNLFWTVSPLLLAERFGLSGRGIGLFALAGAGGALAAPLAGRLADRGFGNAATLSAMAAMGCAFCASIWAGKVGALITLLILAIVIDGAVQTNHIVSQRIVFAMAPEFRGRANALYMTALFCGGAVGSVLGTYAYHHAGWTGAALLGGLMGGVALLLFARDEWLTARG